MSKIGIGIAILLGAGVYVMGYIQGVDNEKEKVRDMNMKNRWNNHKKPKYREQISKSRNSNPFYIVKKGKIIH